MSETKITVKEYSDVVVNNSYSFASGLSEALKSHGEWYANAVGNGSVPEGQRYFDLSQRLEAAYRAESAKAYQWMEAAINNGNTGIANIQNKYANNMYATANSIASDLSNARLNLDLHALTISQTISRLDLSASVNLGKALGPAFDAYQMSEGAVQLVTTGNNAALGAASMGVLASTVLGAVGGAFGIQLSLTAGVILAAGGAAIGSFYGANLFGALERWLEENGFQSKFDEAMAWLFPRDPLVLDLDGDGIETVGIDSNNPIYFDHDADGIKHATGWISSDDGFLVLDLNQNGRIDSGRELFGDQTLKINNAGSSGSNQLHENGYNALKDYDSNNDGWIDVSDTIFSDLRVWRDLNQDGISQSGELFTLAQVGVAKIGVQGTPTDLDFDNGNTQPWGGVFIKANGSFGDSGVAQVSGSLLLGSNTFYRQFSDLIPLTEAAKSLPDIGGSGYVRDLREAMSLEPTLADIVQDYSEADRDGQIESIDSLIKAWSETTDYYSTLEDYLGGTVIITGLPSDFSEADFRVILSVLESFRGERFYNDGSGGQEMRLGSSRTSIFDEATQEELYSFQFNLLQSKLNFYGQVMKH